MRGRKHHLKVKGLKDTSDKRNLGDSAAADLDTNNIKEHKA